MLSFTASTPLHMFSPSRKGTQFLKYPVSKCNRAHVIVHFHNPGKYSKMTNKEGEVNRVQLHGKAGAIIFIFFCFIGKGVGGRQ